LGKNSPPASLNVQKLSSRHRGWPSSMDPSAFLCHADELNHSFLGSRVSCKIHLILALANRLTGCYRGYWRARKKRLWLPTIGGVV
jgi:hypothetical protein